MQRPKQRKLNSKKVKKAKTQEQTASIDTTTSGTSTRLSKLETTWAYLAEVIEDGGGINALKNKPFSLSRLLQAAIKKDPNKRQYFHADQSRKTVIQNKVREWKAFTKAEYIEFVLERYKVRPAQTRDQDLLSFRDTTWDSDSSLPDSQASQVSHTSSEDTYLTQMAKQEAPANDVKKDAQKAPPVDEVRVKDVTKGMGNIKLGVKPSKSAKDGFEWVLLPPGRKECRKYLQSKSFNTNAARLTFCRYFQDFSPWILRIPTATFTFDQLNSREMNTMESLRMESTSRQVKITVGWHLT